MSTDMRHPDHDALYDGRDARVVVIIEDQHGEHFPEREDVDSMGHLVVKRVYEFEFYNGYGVEDFSDAIRSLMVKFEGAAHLTETICTEEFDYLNEDDADAEGAA